MAHREEEREFGYQSVMRCAFKSLEITLNQTSNDLSICLERWHKPHRTNTQQNE